MDTPDQSPLQPQYESRVVVTGGAGFIGSCLVRNLVLEQGAHVLTLDKLTYAGHLASLAAVANHVRHRFVQGDIADSRLVEQLMRDFQPTALIHLAAETHVDRSIDGPLPFVRTNVEGTLLLLEEALRYWNGLPGESQNQFRFVHVSTDEVYGTLGLDGAFSETSAYAPNSPYAASKAASDHFVRAYHQTYGLPTLITNCSNNYGPFQYPEKLIPLMILNALEGRPLPVYGDGQQVRDWLHVSDHVSALWYVLQRGRPGEVYNIGGDNQHTNLYVVKTLCCMLDELCPHLPHRPCESLLSFVEDRPGHDRRYAIDCSKLKRELGWRPQTVFEAGIRQTVQWYVGHRPWIEEVREAGQHRRRLGLHKEK